MDARLLGLAVQVERAGHRPVIGEPRRAAIPHSHAFSIIGPILFAPSRIEYSEWTCRCEKAGADDMPRF